MNWWMRNLAGVLLLSALALPAWPAPYWVAWEGDDYPENQGWQRNWGDENGPGGPGATRTFANGAMTIDSLRDDEVWDFETYAAPTLPNDGEAFVAEWSVLVDPISSPIGTGLTISRGVSPYLGVALEFASGGVHVVDSSVTVPYAPDEAHAFIFRSTDGQSFDLWMDGAHIATGAYSPIGQSFPAVSFGDGTVGYPSKSTWDYVRFGIVPEPGTASLGFVCAAIGLCVRRGRGRVLRCPGGIIAALVCLVVPLSTTTTTNAQTVYRQWNASIDPNYYSLQPENQRIEIRLASQQIFKFEAYEFADPNIPADIGRIVIDNSITNPVHVMVRGDPSHGRLYGARNIVNEIDLTNNSEGSTLEGMSISGNLGTPGIYVWRINQNVSIDGDVNGWISVAEIPSGVTVGIGGTFAALGRSLTVRENMAGTLIAHGPFLGACNFGTSNGLLDFRQTASGAITFESGDAGGAMLFASSCAAPINVLAGNLTGSVTVTGDLTAPMSISGSMTGRLSVSGDLASSVHVGSQLNSEIRIDGSLLNGPATNDIWIEGSLGAAGAITVD